MWIKQGKKSVSVDFFPVFMPVYAQIGANIPNSEKVWPKWYPADRNLL